MERVTSCQQLVGREVPYFERESTRGHIISRDLSGNHPHVLVFCPSLDARECRDYLNAIAADRESYESMDAEVVIITPGHSTADLPFPVIADGLDLFEAFGMIDAEGAMGMGVVVVDRYGNVDSCFASPSPKELPEEQVVATRLRSAESQCPECGVPERSWAAVAETERC